MESAKKKRSRCGLGDHYLARYGKALFVDNPSHITFIQKIKKEFLPEYAVCAGCYEDLKRCFREKVRRKIQRMREKSVSTVIETTSSTNTPSSSQSSGYTRIVFQTPQNPSFGSIVGKAHKNVSLQAQTNATTSAENNSSEGSLSQLIHVERFLSESSTNKSSSDTERGITSKDLGNIKSKQQENISPKDGLSIRRDISHSRVRIRSSDNVTATQLHASTDVPQEHVDRIGAIIMSPLDLQPSTSKAAAEKRKRQTEAASPETRKRVRFQNESPISKQNNVIRRPSMRQLLSEEQMRIQEESNISGDVSDDEHILSVNIRNGTRLPHVQPIARRRPIGSNLQGVMDAYITSITGG